jgi:hypothetical protein
MSQFLGYCIDMVHEHFPWVHIVKGRPRHPASQGSVERSHSPYKKALLAKLKQHNSDDWPHYMHVVQCEVNNRPMRSRGDIKPYTMYFSKANKSPYSAILGKSYKKAETEYGLRLSKIVLEKIKKIDEGRILTDDEVSFIISSGDDLFREAAQRDELERDRNLRREHLDDEEVLVRTTLLRRAAATILRQFHYELEEQDFHDSDMESDDEENGQYDEHVDWLGELYNKLPY